jgi:hypothetical protein
MRTRLAVLAALAALTAAAVPGHAAAPKPQIVDAPNDAVGGQAATEIVSALWSTTGDTVTTKVRGKKKVVYTPKKLVVTLTLAGAPATNPVGYRTAADIAGCGNVEFTYQSGTPGGSILGDAALWHDCGSEETVLVAGVKHTVGATSITWEYPLKALGAKAGAAVTGFVASVDVNEPVFGSDGTHNFDVHVDGAASTTVWKLG